MDILCEQPVYIMNPKIRELLINSRRYEWNGTVYYVDDNLYHKLCTWMDCSLSFYLKNESARKSGQPYKKRYTKLLPFDSFPDRFNKNKADFENCNIITLDGDLQPIYIQVPCGKCIVCINRRQKEMSTRCMAESVVSKSHPLFVTLTFNDKNLPADGVCKEHLQKFFKRLRRRLEYYYGHCGMRYFAVPEYGEDERYTKRPHYHLNLWNMPTFVGTEEEVNYHNLVLFKHIEKAWSREVTESEWNELPPAFRFYEWRKKRKDSKKETRVYYERIGIAECEFARDKSGKYLAGYMNKGKEAQAPFPYKNSADWYLASRGNGGLGKEWLMSNADLYRKHMNLVTCEFVLDSGKTINMCMPKYFINLLYPTRSRIINKECYLRLQRFHYNVNLMNACFNYLIQKNEQIEYSFKMKRTIYDKFNFIKLHRVPTSQSFYTGFDVVDQDYILHLLHEAQFEYVQDVAYLYQYQLNTFDVEGYKLKQKRIDILSVLFMNQKRDSLNKVKDKIISDKLLRDNRKRLLRLQ